MESELFMSRFKINIKLLIFLSALNFVGCGIRSSSPVSAARIAMSRFSVMLSGDCLGDDSRYSNTTFDVLEGCQLDGWQGLSVAELSSEFDRCAEIVTEIHTKVGSASCRQALFEPIRRTFNESAIRIWGVVEKTDKSGGWSPEFLGALSAYLPTLEAQEIKLKAGIYLKSNVQNSETPEWTRLREAAFEADYERVLGAMVETLVSHSPNRTLPAEKLLKNKFSEVSIGSTTLIRAILANEGKADRALIRFSELALLPVLQKASLGLRLADLSCAMTDGCSSQFWAGLDSAAVYRVVSRLLSQTSGRSLNQADLSLVTGSVRELLELLVSNQATLTRAHQSILGKSETGPQWIQSWMALLQEAQSRVNLIEKMGRSSVQSSEFSTPFTPDELVRLGARIQELGAEISQERDRDAANSIELANRYLQLLDDEARSASLDSSVIAAALEVKALTDDLVGLQTLVGIDAAAFSQFEARTEEFMRSDAYKRRYANSSLVPVTEGQIQVPGASNGKAGEDLYRRVHLEGVAAFAVRDSAGGPAVFRMKSGDLMSFQVSGKFSPTCALAAEFPSLSNVSSALTGPEGFSVSFSKGEASAESNSTSKSKSWSSSDTEQKQEYLEGCGSHSVGSSIGVNAGVSFGFSAGVSVSDSTGYSWPEHCRSKIRSFGRRNEDALVAGNSFTSEIRSQAAFERGYRSGFSPFPMAPAGALLAVEVLQDSGMIKNIHVVHQSSVVVADQDTDLVLLVNDCASSEKQTNTLSLRYLQSRSPLQKGAISALTRSMSRGARKIREMADLRLAQGEMTNAELTSLRSEVQSLISVELGAQQDTSLKISDFPEIEGLFQNWLNFEMTQVERKFRILQAQRRHKLAYIKYRELLNQRLLSTKSRPLREALVDWAMQSQNRNILNDQVLALVEFLDKRAFPLLRLLRPDIFQKSALKGSGNSERACVSPALLRMDATSVEMADALRCVVENIRFGETDRLYGANQESDYLVVSIPRTQATPLRAVPPYREEKRPDGSTTVIADTRWSAVLPFNRAEKFWSAIQSANTKEAQVEIRPADVYRAVGNSAIDCNWKLPVVRGMGLYFVVDRADIQDSLNGRRPKLPVLLPNQVDMVDLARVHSFPVASNSLRVGVLPLRFGSSDEVFDNLRQSGQEVLAGPRGMSPVGVFEFQRMDLLRKEFAEVLPSVSEALLIFHYDAVSAREPLRWIEPCR
jgi:hypothetical protein